jgi:hypothetical protein
VITIMKNNVLLLSAHVGLLAAIGIAGCAGQLTSQEQSDLWDEHQKIYAVGAGGSGQVGPATGGGSNTTGTGGAGGSGSLPPVDMCIVTSFTGCKSAGCHGMAPAAMLVLDAASLTTNYKSLYYDKPNAGTPGVSVDLGCPANMYKLVDPVTPEQSLIYQKVAAKPFPAQKPACGEWMPVLGTFTEADKACVLRWINGVIAGSKASP